MNILRKWLWPAAVWVFFIVFYAATMLPQDRIFSAYKSAFRELQHPPGTSLVRAYSFLGTLDKTRILHKADFPQGCDYRVSQLRSYSGARSEIEAFYSSRTLSVDGRQLGVGLLFIPLDEHGIVNPNGLNPDEITQHGPSDIRTLQELRDDQSAKSLKLDPTATYYLVSTGGFSLTDYDVRCQF